MTQANNVSPQENIEDDNYDEKHADWRHRKELCKIKLHKLARLLIREMADKCEREKAHIPGADFLADAMRDHLLDEESSMPLDNLINDYHGMCENVVDFDQWYETQDSEPNLTRKEIENGKSV